MGQDDESVMLHMDWLPPDVKFVFVLVNLRGGATNIAETGASLRLADGSEPGGRFLRQLPLAHVTNSAHLAAVFIRPPPHMYPPNWALQVRQRVPYGVHEKK
jgi:hypothetical protein